MGFIPATDVEALIEDPDRRPDPEEDRNAALGAAITTARSILGYSIEGAAQAIGIAPTILRAVEKGEIAINSALRLQIETSFEMDLAPLVVDGLREFAAREPLEYDEKNGILRVGKLGVAFRRGIDSNDVLLRGFSSAVRSERGVAVTEPLRLRVADLPVLAQLVDLDDAELDERAQFWFGQTPETKQGFRFLLEVARSAPQNAD